MTTIWNTSDKSANVTLSGGSLIATTTSATQGAVRATASISGKTYLEAIVLVSASLWAFGFANSTAALGTQPGGTDKNSVVAFPCFTSAQVNFNNASLGLMAPATVPALSTICVAFDPTGKLIWYRVNNGNWNNSTTANPATGTGGYSVSTINAGPYFPIFAAATSGASILANFGATDFGYVPPSGFAGMDSDTQTYNASSKFLGYASLSPPQTAAMTSKLLGYIILETIPPGNFLQMFYP